MELPPLNTEITFFFRKPSDRNQSIENLFGTLIPQVEQQVTCHRFTVRFKRVTPLGLLGNTLEAWFHCKGYAHITGDIHYLAIVFGKRCILTIHDCYHLNKLKGIQRLFYEWLWYKLPCRRAGKITVISNHSKRELENIVGPLGDRVAVVKNCLAVPISPTTREFGHDTIRILQIGSAPHKNLRRLIEAVIDLDCELVIVGNVASENLDLLRQSGVRHAIEQNVSNARLCEIYRSVDILFFASEFEGFGLPILEGQAAGIPVITSNISSMPEVAGDGALLVNPMSVVEIRDAINEICACNDLRRRLITRGFENLKSYHPADVADAYVDIYKLLSKQRELN